MGGYGSELGMMVDFKPDQAKEKILAAFIAAKANRALCARELDVSREQLWRWVKKLGLEKQIQRIEEKAKREGSRADERLKGGAGPKKRSKLRSKSPRSKKRSKAA